MRRPIAEMTALIEAVRAAQEELLELSYEERRVILSGDAARLAEIVSGEMRALSRINAAEKKRAALLPEVTALLGLPEADATLGAILERAEPDERDALQALQKALKGLIARQGEINAINRNMLEAQQEYTDAMMNALTPAEDPLNNFYGGDGKTTDERLKTTGFLDWKI
jgi:flagellar biosynthesis/type III secretory pathway chaperone